MSDQAWVRRVDPLTGAVVVVSAGRQARPNLPAEPCPVSPGGTKAPAPGPQRPEDE